MNNSTSSITSKIWSFCNLLRDVGVGYGDYLEQLTYLLFLKMTDEYRTALISAAVTGKIDVRGQYDISCSFNNKF